ncbi:C1 family peptidase [Acetatifactor aquisgranensis]|uniref:aminopeptidase C n=1 Tax=Acetatifactor aquisgranensis TaxID=2941233 RepID=UPI0020412F85|nr:C1 family peptidase [Acetatifactor aquisgranensis]
MSESITKELLEQFEKNCSADAACQVAKNAVVENGLKASAKNGEAQRTSRHSFSVNLKQGAITNQKQSGRCWMFAALNTFRFEVIKKLNLENFEISQSYMFFYDKLEKANFFLESILDTLDEPTGSRLIAWLLSAPMNDGGQWDMLCSLVDKYGVVPKYAMPESKASSASGEMDWVLTVKLREDACRLRKAYADGAKREELASRKEEMLGEIYRILCICLGEPPKTFDFEVEDKDGKFIRECGLTPKAFFEKYVGLNLNDYISLINAPTADKPYHRSYSVKFLGNVKEGRQVRYLNLEIEELKKAAIAQMKDGSPVWFGCDVGKCSTRDGGVMDTNVYKLEELLGMKFGMDKAERLDYGESLMTHAMVFQGVNLDESGKPNRWRVENSWGEEPGEKGYYVMSDDWFDEYMYQIVVNKKYLSEELVKEYESEPILLEPWDPMGSLAVVRG